MAVNSTSSSPAVSSGLDVTAIVSGLMTVERLPVDKLDAKIADVTTQISALGELKGLVSGFQSAVANLENTGLFATRTTTSTDTSAVSVTATSAATLASHDIQVIQTASVARVSFGGFPAADSEIDLTSFELVTNEGTYTADDFDDGLTLSEFRSALNALDAGVSASLTAQASGRYILTLTTTSTGADQLLGVDGLATADEDELLRSEISVARDAFLAVGGVIYQRSSNEIDDIVNGVTISLISPVRPDVVLTGIETVTIDDPDGDYLSLAATTATDSILFSDLLGDVPTTVVAVSDGSSDRSESLVRELVSAHNALVEKFGELTARSADANSRGALVSDSFLTAYMQRMKDLYSKGVAKADGSVVSLADFGVESQLDGTLQIDEIVFADALSGGLRETLAAGVILGRESSTSNLNSFLRSSLRVNTGIFSRHVADVEGRQSRLEADRVRMEDRLVRVEARLYSQYSALDALLMRMQVTSNALASAIDSLVNSQKS